MLVKEINHLLLGEPKGNVAHIDSPGLSSNGGSHYRNSSLGSIWHQTCRNLSSSLRRYKLCSTFYLVEFYFLYGLFRVWSSNLFIWSTCMDLYCIGVICSNPGGGTSQYSEGLRLLVLGLRSLDLDLGYLSNDYFSIHYNLQVRNTFFGPLCLCCDPSCPCLCSPSPCCEIFSLF